MNTSTNPPKKFPPAIDPIELVMLVLPRWRFLVFIVAVFTAIAYYYAKSAPYVYRAAARVEVFKENRLRDRGTFNEYDRLESHANRHIILMSGEMFHKDLIAKLSVKWKNQLPEGQLRVPFQIQGVGRSNSMIDLFVDSTNENYALDYLQGILGSYRNQRKRELSQINDNALAGLREEEKRIQSELTQVKHDIEQFEIENQVLLAQERELMQSELINELLSRLQVIKMERSILEFQYDEIVNADLVTIRAALMMNQDSHIREFLLDYGHQQQTGIPFQPVPGAAYSLETNNAQAFFSWEQQENLLASLENNYAQRLEVFQTTHPKMKELKIQIKALKSSLEKKLEIALRRFQARYQALKRKEEAIEEVIKNIQNEKVLTADTKHKYVVLTSQESQLKSKYDLVYQRLLENAGSIDNLLFITIQEPYIWEDPIAPNKLKILAVGPVLGLSFGVAFILLKGFFLPLLIAFFKQQQAPVAAVPSQ